MDYIFTDPPYGAHIAYLDLIRMWDAWFGFQVSDEDRDAEAIEGGDVGHGADDYNDISREREQRTNPVHIHGSASCRSMSLDDPLIKQRLSHLFRQISSAKLTESRINCV